MTHLSRIFVICAHKAALNSAFTLNDLPGSGGRMDILARFITSALCISHGLRKDVDVYLVIQNQLLIRFEGASVKRLNPDERSTGALIKKAIEQYEKSKARLDENINEIESTPGVYVSVGSLGGLLDGITNAGISTYVLDESGQDIRNGGIETPAAFVLSDHQEFTDAELSALTKLKKLSLGAVVLQADQCVPIVHNELDRRSQEF